MAYISRKHDLTKEVLDRNKIWIEFDEDGQPLIYQDYIKTGKRNTEKRWKTERIQSVIKKEHEHSGNTYEGIITSVKIDGQVRSYVVSNLVWVYFNSPIPVGYDVDHINENPLDNRLDNLQLLTRQENLNKRNTAGINQYNCHLSVEEMQANRAVNNEHKEEVRERVEHSKRVREQKEILEDLYRRTWEEKKQWEETLKIAKKYWHDAPSGSAEKVYYKKLQQFISDKINALQAEKVQIKKYIKTSPKKWDI